MTSSTYAVRGMTCDHCVGSVTAEVARIPGVTEVDVDLARGRLTVVGTEAIPDEAVTEAVEEAGYAVVGRPDTSWPASE